MAITRWTYRNPWRELDTLTNRLGQMFDEGGFPTPSDGGAWLPAVNVEETADRLILSAELPGMKRDEVELEVENNILTLRGEKSESRQEGDENRRYHLWERKYGSFQRSFTLPRTVKADEISAEFTDGILHVRMPKVAEAQSRRITIGTNQDAITSGQEVKG
jgi:HSP20 family protein